MDALLAEARNTTGTEGDLDQAWCNRAATARDGVVRQSLELRAVATRLPAAT
jgi:hypothetical protein